MGKRTQVSSQHSHSGSQPPQLQFWPRGLMQQLWPHRQGYRSYTYIRPSKILVYIKNKTLKCPALFNPSHQFPVSYTI